MKVKKTDTLTAAETAFLFSPAKNVPEFIDCIAKIATINQVLATKQPIDIHEAKLRELNELEQRRKQILKGMSNEYTA